jgi:hypothetical protein
LHSDKHFKERVLAEWWEVTEVWQAQEEWVEKAFNRLPVLPLRVWFLIVDFDFHLDCLFSFGCEEHEFVSVYSQRQALLQLQLNYFRRDSADLFPHQTFYLWFNLIGSFFSHLFL